MTEAIDMTPLLKRKVLWDSAPCGRVADLFLSNGLIPGSDEGNEIDHRASHRRLNRLLPIREELEQYAELTGEVLARVILEDQGIEDLDSDDPRIVHWKNMIHAGSMTVIANLIDDGSLVVNGGVLL